MSAVSPLTYVPRIDENYRSGLPPKKRKYAQTSLSSRDNNQLSKIRRTNGICNVHSHADPFVNTDSDLSSQQSSDVTYTQSVANENLSGSLDGSRSSSTSTLSELAYHSIGSDLPAIQSPVQSVFTRDLSPSNSASSEEVASSRWVNEDILRRAKVHTTNREYTEALRALRKFNFLEASPEQRNVYCFTKAYFHKERREYAEALNVLQGFNVQEASSRQKSDYCFIRAQMHSLNGEYEHALVFLRGFNLQEASPEQKNAYCLTKAHSYMLCGQFVQAQSVLQEFNFQEATPWQKNEYCHIKADFHGLRKEYSEALSALQDFNFQEASPKQKNEYCLTKAYFHRLRGEFPQVLDTLQEFDAENANSQQKDTYSNLLNRLCL